jgi:hypothetical protein
LCNIFHRGPLSIDLPVMMNERHDPLLVCGQELSVWVALIH